MAVVGSLVVLLGVNNAALTAGLTASEAQLKAFGATTTNTMARASTAMAGIGIVAVVGLGLAAKAAADFESQMNTINTIAHLTPPALDKVGVGIRKLAVESGSSLPDLTASFYDLLSVGVQLADTQTILANAVTLSRGGLGTVNEAVTAITGSINAWSVSQGGANLQMSDSVRVMDVLAKAIELGDIKTRDLPAAFADVASTAAAFNVPIEEVAASLALMSTKFIDPTKGAVAMTAAFTALDRVPPGMQKLQDITGKTYATIAKTQGMHGALMELVADAEKFGVNMVDVFGRVDALPFVRSTTGAAATQFLSFLSQEYDANGTAALQAAERNKGLTFQLDRLGASVNDLAINVGTVLLPPLTDFVTQVSGAVQSASDWSAKNPGLATTIAQVAGALVALSAGMRLVSFLGAPVRLAMSGIGLAAGSSLTAGVATGIGLGTVGIVAAILLAAVPIGEAFKAWLPPELKGPGGKGESESQRRHGEALGVMNQKAWGTLNTPGFHAGEVGSPFAGPPTPASGGLVGARGPGALTVNHTTNVHLDGQKIGEVVDRYIYDSAANSSSGFSGALVTVR